MKTQAELAFDLVLTGVTITCLDYKADKQLMRSVPYVLQVPVILGPGVSAGSIGNEFLYGVVPGLLDFVTRGFNGSDLIAIIPTVQINPRLEHFSTRQIPRSLRESIDNHLSTCSLTGKQICRT